MITIQTDQYTIIVEKSPLSGQLEARASYLSPPEMIDDPDNPGSQIEVTRDPVPEPVLQVTDSGAIHLWLGETKILDGFRPDGVAPTCDKVGCNNPIVAETQYALTVAFVSQRVRNTICYGFCSRACGDAWWEEIEGNNIVLIKDSPENEQDAAGIILSHDTDPMYCQIADKSGLAKYDPESAYQFNDASVINEWWNTPEAEDDQVLGETKPSLLFWRDGQV